MGYQWQNNLACVATYKVLSGKALMNQFSEANVAFSEAHKLKMGTLPYYPHTASPAGAGKIAGLAAVKFLKGVAKNYKISKEDPQIPTSDIEKAVKAIFAKKDATLLELAEQVDVYLRFADEVGHA